MVLILKGLYSQEVQPFVFFKKIKIKIFVLYIKESTYEWYNP